MVCDTKTVKVVAEREATSVARHPYKKIQSRACHATLRLVQVLATEK